MSIKALLRMEHAENSIMQTITIAISVILVAAGMLTAPGVIMDARDSNTKTDLANVAYAQERALGEYGHYFSAITPEAKDSLADLKEMKYKLSSTSKDYSAVVCTNPDAYIIKGTSQSGKTFYRSSFSPKTSFRLSDIQVPACTPSDFGAVESPVIAKPAPSTPPAESKPVATTPEYEYAPKADIVIDAVGKTNPTVVDAAAIYAQPDMYFQVFNSSSVTFSQAKSIKDGLNGSDAKSHRQVNSDSYDYFDVSYTYGNGGVAAKAYDSQDRYIGDVRWQNDSSGLYVNGSPWSASNAHMRLSTMTFDMKSWQGYYDVFNGGSVVIDFGGYVMKFKLGENMTSGKGLKSPSSLQNSNGNLELFWGGIAENGKVRLKNENTTFIKEFMDNSRSSTTRALNGTATVYFSPTGKSADYAVDAKSLKVKVVNNEIQWVDGYTYSKNKDYYRQVAGQNQARGSWKIEVTIDGTVATFYGVAPGWN